MSSVWAGRLVTMPGMQDLIRALAVEGVRDSRLLEAIRQVPREGFVPNESAGEAYLDEPVPIAHGQVTSQPSLVARMVEALGLTGEERVLEIGSGYGYQSALLARLADRVVTVEYWDDLATRARENLTRQAVDNVDVVTSDGSQGMPEHAPYDAIIVSAAFPRVPDPLVQQLRPGGRLVQPIGSGGQEIVVCFERSDEGLVRREELTPASFVPLLGRYGYPEE